MSVVCKRFAQGQAPYSAEKISEECQIPIRLTRQIIYELQETGLLNEVSTDEKSESIAYQPSMDISRLSVAVLLDRLYTHGSEDFKIDREHEFSNEWKALQKAREAYHTQTGQILLKDL